MNPEKNCREEIRYQVLKAASTLTLGTTVTDFKNLAATGNAVRSATGEMLYEYTLDTFTTPNGPLPYSSATIYVKRDPAGCFVIRLNMNLR